MSLELDAVSRRSFLKRAGLVTGSVVAGLSAADLLAACGAPGASETATSSSGLPAQVKIGMNTELTGKGATVGQLAQKAAQLATDEINAKGGIGGKAKIQLLVQDAASSDQGAVTAFRKSIDQESVDVFLGPVKSTQVLAMIDQINEAKVPTIVGGTNPTLTHKGVKWLFRMRPDDSIAAPAMVKYLTEELKFTKVGILHDSDAFGTAGGELVIKALQAKSLQPVSNQAYTTGDKSYTAQLTNLKSANPEAVIFYGTNAPDDAQILQQIKQLGLAFTVMGSPSYAQTITRDLAKEAQDGIYVTVDYLPDVTDVAKKYFDSYKSKNGQEPDDLSAWAYDSIYVFKKAIEDAGSVDKEKVRDALSKIKNFQRVVGTVSFDKYGNGLHSVAVVQMAGGRKTLKKNVTVAADA